jgi:hypothetical protein
VESMEFRGIHLRLKNYLTSRRLVLNRLPQTTGLAAEIRCLDEYVNYLRNLEREQFCIKKTLKS